MCVNPGSASPCKRLSKWGIERKDNGNVWSRSFRKRIAWQVNHIRHWRVIHGDYTEAPDVDATWHVDPPYQGMGKHYPCGADDIDFAALGDWCRTRSGQVMVCENQGADWLPFRYLGVMRANPVNLSGVSNEVIWTNTEPDQRAFAFARR